MSTIDFWKAVAERDYDLYVLGEKKPDEIRQFLKEEDESLETLLYNYVGNKLDTVFVEIGSGTGRYFQYFGKKIITDKLYREHLKFIVGIDFCKNMIRKSIENLSQLANELAQETNRSIESIKEELSQRIIPIQGDATRPFLRVSGGKVVVGIMFGTLGNIREREKVLKSAARILGNDGKIIISVFNNEFMDIGFNVYRSLAQEGFVSLSNLNSKNSDFTAPTTGFYSHWFSHKEFKELLERHFRKKPDIIPFRKRGLLAVAQPRISRRGKKLPKGISLRILCPNCNNNMGILLPLKVPEIYCHQCKRKYVVEKLNGFYFPVIGGE